MARSSGSHSQKVREDVKFLLRQAKELGHRSPERMTHAEIAAACGVGLSFVNNMSRAVNAEASGAALEASRAMNATNGFESRAEVVRESSDFAMPLSPAEMSPEARRGLEDIEFFARRFYGIVLLPWQVLAARKIDELLETPHEEYAVINVAPGSGKSVFFGRILPSWLTARDRSIRGLIGSATNNLAVQMVDQLRRMDFIRARPERISEREVRMGRVQPVSTLPLDYGRFRPDVEGAIWTRQQFEVAQIDDELMGRKEPTWQAFGRDSTFIGQRVDFCLWDDLWDVRSVRTVEAREEFFRWFDNTAEARLEPGGLFLLQGQRLAPDDVYAYALSKTADLDYGDFEQIESDEDRPKRYHHIVFKALDESKLTGDKEKDRFLLSTAAPAWPEGPLLSPFRLPYRRLSAIRSSTPDTFSLTYQQDDTDLVETLISPIWLEGGEDHAGVSYPGCLDTGRHLLEMPETGGPTVSVAMTDPSGTAYWGHLWYLWETAHEAEADVRHVMDVEWRKMTADQFLDYNQRTGEYSGLMEDWWQRSKERGHPIKYWIVERNAAQRYLLQYEHVRTWQQTRGVQIVAHDTGANKADPDYGVASLAPVVQRGLLRIPWADTTATGGRRSMRALDLTKQLREYGGDTKSKDDLVMAAWFFEHKKDALRPIRQDESKRLPRPEFAARFGAKKKQDYATGRLFGRNGRMIA